MVKRSRRGRRRFFGSQITVTATWGSQSASKTIDVLVPGLQQLSAGSNYNIVGSTSTHPVNNWVTSVAIANLKAIANDYQAMYYTSTPPSGDRLRYNDMSLEKGGKFDLAANWCTNCSHFEHLDGRSVDIGSSNVPSARWPALNTTFLANGASSVLDETASANHWHVRF